MSDGTAEDEFLIGQVQLERGAAATEFEFRSIQEELALCQRYYYQNNSSLSGVENAWHFQGITPNYGSGGRNYPVPMRVDTLTVTLYDSAGTAASIHNFNTGADIGITVNAGEDNKDGFTTVNKTDGMTAGSQYGANVKADAEL